MPHCIQKRNIGFMDFRLDDKLLINEGLSTAKRVFRPTDVVVGYLDKGSDRPNDVKEEVVCNKGNG